MGTQSSPADIQALIKWINTLPPEPSSNVPDDLSDGFRLWEVLRQLDPDFFTDDLPRTPENSSKMILRLENLKHIVRSVERYISSRGYIMPNSLDIDVQTAASNGTSYGLDMFKLLKMVLYAVLKSPQLAEYVSMMLGLEMESQTSLMMIIKMLETPPEPLKESIDDVPSINTGTTAEYPEMDAALRYEERLSELMAERDKLMREKQDLQRDLREFDNRHTRLQENNEVLQQQLANAQDLLTQDQHRGSEESHIRKLEIQVQQQDDIIAGQEIQLNELQEASDNFNKEVGRLRKENERIQPLQDELDETRAQRDQFAKRANTADKYKQKLQESAELEKENQLLRGELEELRFEKGDGSNARSEIAGLQRTLEEYKNLLPSIERERHELQMMLKQYERDNADMGLEVETVKEQLMKAQEQITELQAGHPPSPLDEEGRGLAREMEDSEHRQILESMPPEERSKQLLKEVDEMRAELFMRKQRSEDQEVKYSQLEKRFEELHLEKMNLEKEGTNADMMRDNVKSPEPEVRNVGTTELETNEAQKYVQDAMNAKLKERIHSMEAQDPSLKKTADAATMKQELIVLRQENKLISTAWYDLNGRTHMNNVILQRRSELPRGILKAAREFAEKSMVVRGR